MRRKLDCTCTPGLEVTYLLTYFKSGCVSVPDRYGPATVVLSVCLLACGRRSIHVNVRYLHRHLFDKKELSRVGVQAVRL